MVWISAEADRASQIAPCLRRVQSSSARRPMESASRSRRRGVRYVKLDQDADDSEVESRLAELHSHEGCEHRSPPATYTKDLMAATPTLASGEGVRPPVADWVRRVLPVSPGLVFTWDSWPPPRRCSVWMPTFPALPAIAAELGCPRKRLSCPSHRLPAGLGIGRSSPVLLEIDGVVADRCRRRGPLRGVVPRLRDRSHFGHLHRAAPGSGPGWSSRPRTFAGGCPRSREGQNGSTLYSQLAAVSGAAPVLAPIAGGLIIGCFGLAGRVRCPRRARNCDGGGRVRRRRRYSPCRQAGGRGTHDSPAQLRRSLT